MRTLTNGLQLLLLCLLSQLSQAAVFQWTDAQGRKHYSDSKQRNATEYTIRRDYSYYAVQKVYDGDTIQLIDGRKIRLLGINTPEVEHSRNEAQAGGDIAKQWLIQQLAGSKVRLEFDQEKQDKYHRYLAHIFTEQGLHINLELVRLGYASLNVFPPNLKYVAELLKAEQTAEALQVGIWKYADYVPKSASQLTKKNSSGWQRVWGRVESVKYTHKNVYLQLEDNFTVRLSNKNSQYFTDLNVLQGQQVEVRGWVRRYRQGYSMLLRHPSAMKTF
ncbi:MAG: micrococcal nuclease [Methyloprofundus sp.]|nr:MAG: micrococcal nuclease [Methyloprofundus sp.]